MQCVLARYSVPAVQVVKAVCIRDLNYSRLRSYKSTDSVLHFLLDNWLKNLSPVVQISVPISHFSQSISYQ